jgi:hypothetical protein
MAPKQYDTPSTRSHSPDIIDRQFSVDVGAKTIKEPANITGLATQETQRMEAALGDWLLRSLRFRKGKRNDNYDLDAVCKVVTGGGTKY